MSISYAQLAHFSRQFRAHYDRQFLPFLEQWDLSMTVLSSVKLGH